MNKFKRLLFCIPVLLKIWISGDSPAQNITKFQNPLIYSDVPDMSIIRVKRNYYMTSTTMHMSPGIPVMMSKDLVNWHLINYVYDTLGNVDELNLSKNKSAYGHGSWASSLRYHDGRYYVSTFSQTTDRTYLYSTKDIKRGPWKRVSFQPALHDHSLFFDDNGKAYFIYGSGKIMIAELNEQLTGLKAGSGSKVLIENAGEAAHQQVGLPAEGSQMFKRNEYYYLFNIIWPRGGMRTVIIHRARKLEGPYEGRIALQDKGIAQGGLVNTPNGSWFAYLFRDFGAVGRVPYLVPVKWEKDWPVLGIDGKVPDTLPLPARKGLIPGIVASDEFNRKKNDNKLTLVWQWNHNPADLLWSLTQRPGYLRLTTDRIDTTLLLARNTLTQRTIGPQCSGTTCLDVSGMKDGDRSGLVLLQQKYGWIGIKMDNGVKSIVMVGVRGTTPTELTSVPFTSNRIFLKADCDFTEKTDRAYFYYSLDGQNWHRTGMFLQMAYTIPQFMGYRFGLFNYSTRQPGGHVDFDYFRITDKITEIK